MSRLKLAGFAAFGAFVLSGPLQHVGAIPQTAVGDASKSMLKVARDAAVGPAWAACGPGNIGGGNVPKGNGKGPQGNNGFGNGGGDGVPGRSGHSDRNR